MNRISPYAIVVCLAVATGSVAAEATRMEMAAELIALMKVQESMDGAINAVKQMIPMQLQQIGMAPENAAEREEAMAVVMAMISEVMGWEHIEEEVATVYAEVLTEEELRALIDFYGSPVGQTFIEKQPQLLARSMQISQRQMMNVVPLIKAKMEEMKTARSEQQ